MNPQQLKRVFIVLGVVIALWLVSEMLSGGLDDSESALVLPALTMSEVDAITITRPSGTNNLRRVGDSTWTINGYEAAQASVQEFFDGLVESVDADLVATSSSVHSRMGVDSAEGIFVKFESGSESLASVVFGKRGRAYNSRYVRLEGEEPVYQYLGGLSGLIDRSETDWRNKDMLSVEPDSVGRVVARRSEGSYTLNRSEDGWLLGGGGAADSAAVHRMLNQYNSLQASGFAEDSQMDSVDFVRPDRSVTLFGLDGEELASMDFDSTSSAYWVRVESDSVVYRILQWKANQMIPVDSTLRGDEEG